MHKFSRLSLGLLLAGAGLLVGGVQSRAEMGWWSGQASGSAVGNPERGKPIAAASCASCHGPDGNSSDPRYPKLAGQSAPYLYWQLWAFKTGVRKSDIMAEIVKALPDADMADVASFYERQAVQPDTVTDAGLADLGAQIFLAGVGPGVAPACVMCHGRGMPMMMGRMPMMGMMMGTADVPSLNGQHAPYIVDQLNRFASGKRQSTVMGGIAAALSETNRKAVAEYLSGLQ